MRMCSHPYTIYQFTWVERKMLKNYFDFWDVVFIYPGKTFSSIGFSSFFLVFFVHYVYRNWIDNENIRTSWMCEERYCMKQNHRYVIGWKILFSTSTIILCVTLRRKWTSGHGSSHIFTNKKKYILTRRVRIK